MFASETRLFKDEASNLRQTSPRAQRLDRIETHDAAQRPRQREGGHEGETGLVAEHGRRSYPRAAAMRFTASGNSRSFNQAKLKRAYGEGLPSKA